MATTKTGRKARKLIPTTTARTRRFLLFVAAWGYSTGACLGIIGLTGLVPATTALHVSGMVALYIAITANSLLFLPVRRNASAAHLKASLHAALQPVLARYRNCDVTDDGLTDLAVIAVTWVVDQAVKRGDLIGEGDRDGLA